MGFSVLSGSLTLALMVLPTIIRTSEEAIRAVPYAYREVSFGLGSTRWQTVIHVVLRSALPAFPLASCCRLVGASAKPQP